jgi:hypothetical protein
MMSFRLKSASATYPRGIQRCVHTQLGRNTEAYVDDVVVKTREDEGQMREDPLGVAPRRVASASHSGGGGNRR